MPDVKPTPNYKIVFEPLYPAERWIMVINGATKTSGLNDGSANDTGWLKGRTISSVGVIAAPTGMTKNTQSNTTTTITIDMTAGADVGDFEWDVIATLNTGEIKRITAFISIGDNGTN